MKRARATYISESMGNSELQVGSIKTESERAVVARAHAAREE